MSQAGRFGASGGGGAGTVSFLAGNSGGNVGPTGGGVINVVGTGAISVAGNPGTNTLTITEAGSVATTYNEDSGSATPAAGVLNINGGSNITTAGSGNTVSIEVSGTTNHAVQLGNSTGSLTSTAVGTNGQLLVAATSGDPTWVTPTAGNGLSITTNATTLAYALTAPVSIANGGTNATAMATTDGTVIFDGTRLVTTATGTAGQLLTSNGAGVAPTYQAAAASSISITGNSGGALTGNAFTFTGGTTGLTFAGAGTTEILGGTLVVANGGTGAATLTANSVLLGNGTSAISTLGAATNGQLIIGSTSNPPVLATITAGTNITVTNGAGSITIATTATPFTWNTVTGTSASMAMGNGYISNNAGLVTLTLPSAATFGSSIRVTGQGAGGWKIAQNAGQTINFGVSTTTSGTGGSLASTNTFDSVDIVCIVANTTFNILSSIGNITVV
jgi:hypothetical protein